MLWFPIFGVTQSIFPTNSSPAGPSTVPVGWTMLLGSTDVSDNVNWAGWYPWEDSPSDPPNGHTVWVSGWWNEKVGTTISDLIIDEVYTMSFYTAEMRSASAGDIIVYDGTLIVNIDGTLFYHTYTGGIDNSWSLVTLTFVATGTSMPVDFQYQAPYDGAGTLWNISFGNDVVEVGCDSLVAEVSATEICFGDEITLSAASMTGGTVTWDGGVVNDVAFEPPLGTTTYTATSDNENDCVFDVDITVYEYPEFDIVLADDEICDGESITLGVDGDADTFEWSDPGIESDVAFTPDIGEYEYILTGTNGVCWTEETVSITVHAKPVVDALVDDAPICLGESFVLYGSGADTYIWEDGIIDGEPFTPLESGDVTYIVEGFDIETGCSNTASVTITVHEAPTVSATATSTEICFGESIVLTGSGAVSYMWTGDVIDGLSFTPGSIGTNTYTVTGTNEFGCQSTATITITVTDCEPVIAGFEMPNATCINECFILVDTSLGAVTEWAWDFGGATDPNTSSLQNPTICLNTVGTYTITLTTTSETGVVSTTSKSLVVNPNPTVIATLDTIIDIGGSANLIGTSLSDGEYSWEPEFNVECPDCAITSASPSQSQTYTVTLIDYNGCKALDSVMVLVNYQLSVGVPTAFSPNGDGNNDVLFVKGHGLTYISLIIYNRYGERIFETTDQNIGWDGTFLNRDENPGVFTWVLHYTTEDEKKGILKGNTTLIR